MTGWPAFRCGRYSPRLKAGDARVWSTNQWMIHSIRILSV
jgi:hypothetical protein